MYFSSGVLTQTGKWKLRLIWMTVATAKLKDHFHMCCSFPTIHSRDGQTQRWTSMQHKANWIYFQCFCNQLTVIMPFGQKCSCSRWSANTYFQVCNILLQTPHLISLKCPFQLCSLTLKSVLLTYSNINAGVRDYNKKEQKFSQIMLFNWTQNG